MSHNGVLRRPLLAAGALTAALTVTLTGCGASDDQQTGATAGFLVTLENCGAQTTVDAAPRRIVSLNQGSTEILLSLGLAERMVGAATWTDPILPSLAAQAAKVPRLSENYPSFEAVLAAEPDLVTSSFGSTLGKGGVAPRDRFDEMGVPTYLAPSDCDGKRPNGGDGVREKPASLDQIYREITELGRLTGTGPRATALIEELRTRADRAAKSVDARGVRVMFWYANAESPYLAGCCGAPGIITASLGLKNVFDDTREEWPQINWEVVAERDPQVLVLGDLTRRSQTAESAQAKIDFLERNPVTREMDAVKNKRYIFATGAEMNPSLRTVYGIANVAEALVRLGLGK